MLDMEVTQSDHQKIIDVMLRAASLMNFESFFRLNQRKFSESTLPN